MKKCFKCDIVQPLSEFYKHKEMADGHLNKCKSCTKKDIHEHRHGKGRDTILAYDRKRSSEPHRVSQRLKIIADWTLNNPLRRSAQNKLARAVKSGKIKKQACFICGDEKSEAHHSHYDSPLCVTWLCRVHHMQAHSEIITPRNYEPTT